MLALSFRQKSTAMVIGKNVRMHEREKSCEVIVKLLRHRWFMAKTLPKRDSMGFPHTEPTWLGRLSCGYSYACMMMMGWVFTS